MENKPKSSRNWVMLGILFIIVIAPVVGVWNTYNAAQIRKKTLAELPKVQKLDNLNLKTDYNSTLTSDSLIDRLTLLVHFDTKKTAESEKIVTTLARMDEQFGKLEQTQFFVISDSTILAKNQIHSKIRDISNFVFLEDQPTKGFDFQPNTQFAVVDTAAIVRNFYNINEEESVRAMVRHFPFLIPVKKAAKPKLVVNPEK